MKLKDIKKEDFDALSEDDKIRIFLDMTAPSKEQWEKIKAEEIDVIKFPVL